MNDFLTPPRTDEYFMKAAYAEALKAEEEGEIPIGAVVVLDEKIIAKGHNQVERLKDSTAHAEIIALTAAYAELNSKYLPSATLYVTLEPCLMCSGALYWGQISRIVYGASDLKSGFSKYFSEPIIKHPFHPKAEIVSGVMQNECAVLMKRFFEKLRS